jgi:hypothetical protein
MLAAVSRGFTKLYNELKHKPKIRFDPKLRKGLHLAPKVAHKLKEQIEGVKKLDQFVPLSTYTKASKKEAQYGLKPPVYVTSTDTTLEKRVKKAFVQDVVRPVVETYSKQMKEDYFILDKSEEAVKNRILIQETEQAELILAQQKEQARRIALPSVDPKVILGLRRQEGGLPKLSTTALSKAEDLVMSVGEVTSFKGTVDLASRSEGVVRFSHLSHRELANYVCYNLESVEAALQLFKYSRESSQYDTNLKAATLQKTALLSEKYTDLSKDPRVLDCLRDISEDIGALTDKNLCDTMWAVGKLLGPSRERPQIIIWLIQKAVDEAGRRWEQLTAMQIAYLLKGLDFLMLYPAAVVEAALEKLKLYVAVCEQLPQGLRSVKYYPDQVTGHSFFYGYTDYTVPRTPLPMRAVDFISRFLVHSASLTAEMENVLRRAASVVNKQCIYEADTPRALSVLKTFTSSASLGTSTEVQHLITSLMEHLDLGTLTQLEQINHLIQSLLDAKMLHLVGLFDNLVAKSALLIGGHPDTVCTTARLTSRYLWIQNRGVDPLVEPHYWMLPCLSLKHNALHKLLDFASSQPLEPQRFYAIVESVCSFGYRVETLELKECYECLLAQAVVRDDSLVHVRKYTEELVEVLALLHLGQTEGIDSGHFARSVLFNKKRLTSKQVVPALWCLVYLQELQAASQLAELLETDDLSCLQLTLLWQVHLGLPSILLSSELKEKSRSAYHSWKLLVPHESASEVVLSTYSAQYDLPNFDPVRKTSSVKVMPEGVLRSGKLVGMLRLQVRQLESVGISLDIHT